MRTPDERKRLHDRERLIAELELARARRRRRGLTLRAPSSLPLPRRRSA
jgi:hypothetical protein